jgi:hypothetical protein
LAFSLGVKEAQHSPPSTAEVKSGGAVSLLLKRCLTIEKHRDNVTFTLSMIQTAGLNIENNIYKCL